jgi:hypothetical protein
MTLVFKTRRHKSIIEVVAPIVGAEVGAGKVGGLLGELVGELVGMESIASLYF